MRQVPGGETEDETMTKDWQKARSIKMTDAEWAAARAAADRLGISTAELVRRALVAYIAEATGGAR